MKLATWNVNGLRARAAQFCDWMSKEQPDVVCLQELKCEHAQVPEACKLPDYDVYWHCMRAYSGVALLLRKNRFGAQPAFAHPSFDMESRIVCATAGNLVLASVYVPNGGKDYGAKIDFMQRLAAWTKQVTDSGRELVLCGDMNITRTEVDVHPAERKPNMIGQRAEERALFDSLLGRHLVDVHRRLDPDNDRLFTWWAPWRRMRERNIGWRLDYVLASPSIAEQATSCVVQRETGTSDHGPVVMITS